jgi:transposase
VLRKMARSRKIKAGDARRAKVILRLAKGESYQRIMLVEGCGSEFITRWRKRFEAERLGDSMPGIEVGLFPIRS